jgi:Uma2 family endonuclease
MAVRPPVTAEELLRLPRPDGNVDIDYELVRGRLVPVTPAGREHGVLSGYLATELTLFVRAHGLGRVYTDGVGYTLFRNPDTVRGPDVSYVSREREATLTAVRGFINGAPDLAVEVRSPDDRWPTLEAKATEYLTAGARLVWIVDPRRRMVQVRRPGQPPVVLRGADVLDGGDLLAGWSLPVSRLFAELD